MSKRNSKSKQEFKQRLKENSKEKLASAIEEKIINTRREVIK